MVKRELMRVGHELMVCFPPFHRRTDSLMFGHTQGLDLFNFTIRFCAFLLLFVTNKQKIVKLESRFKILRVFFISRLQLYDFVFFCDTS